MNIVLGLQHKVVLAWQQLFRSATATRTADSAQRVPVQARGHQAFAYAPVVAPCQRMHTRLPHTNKAPARSLPLRVVRVMDADQPRAHSGRMVISGRMADVCAELDRLAAREAALA